MTCADPKGAKRIAVEHALAIGDAERLVNTVGTEKAALAAVIARQRAFDPVSVAEAMRDLAIAGPMLAVLPQPKPGETT